MAEIDSVIDPIKAVLLIVEDNRADVVLFKRALSLAGVACEPVVARDGKGAFEYLRSRSETDSAVHLLLDLKLPRISGLELLASIRADDGLQHLPAIVLSSSDLESDIEEAHRLGIDAYLVKPNNMSEFVETAVKIATIWGLPLAPAKR